MSGSTRVTAMALLFVTFGIGAQVFGGEAYWPGKHEWQRRTPEAMGLDADKIDAAIAVAMAAESQAPRDLAFNHQLGFGREPHGEPVGPFSVRGPQTGLVVYKGYVVAEWGEPERVDMTFSVSKSFLSTTVGLALDDGLIASVDDLVRDYMPPVVLDHGDGEPGSESGRLPKRLFESAHNQKIRWNHLLRQTSDWEGTLWGKPEWADRPDEDRSTWGTRPRFEPGSAYEYNDVRVNLLALAATSVWRRPLPVVLRDRVMDPIGASNTWRWYGYDNSWVTIDGRQVQVVSGGGHWGGGMHLSAFDQARFGLFTLHRGLWNGERLLSEAFFEIATTPGEMNPNYGFMNFTLNTDHQAFARAPETTWTHRGAGSNLIYVDPVNELVVVARWINGRAFPDVVHLVLDALGERAIRL